MKTLLAILLCICLVAPAAYAAAYRYGECPRGHSCESAPGDAFPPEAVTGHTVYASWVLERRAASTLGLPTDFAAVAGYFAVVARDVEAVQRECVTWFDGANLDQRPDPDRGGANAFPSDEERRHRADVAYQDYDFDRDVRDCLPRIRLDETVTYTSFAVAVERGDCAPHLGQGFRFRGHLDFVDPNDIYHEVQEYDYSCGGFDGRDVTGSTSPKPIQVHPHRHVSDAVKALFPWTYTDPHNEQGCKPYATPLNGTDPANGTVGHFDLGHKCNGSMQELFTERLWITRVHAPIWDPTVQASYNFALQVDTCAGLNMHEVRGKDATGESNDNANASRQPRTALDELAVGLPLVDTCTDGSSWSFDDTPRGRTVHSGPPSDEAEVMRGNSYGVDPSDGTTFGKHRAQCRDAGIRWPYSDALPSDPHGDCYPEDHRTARIDLYVYDLDPTRGHWYANTNGMTGPNAYVGGAG